MIWSNKEGRDKLTTHISLVEKSFALIDASAHTHRHIFDKNITEQKQVFLCVTVDDDMWTLTGGSGLPPLIQMSCSVNGQWSESLHYGLPEPV